MAIGPGKYDDLTTDVRIRTKAAGVLLVIIDGDQGSGFSAQLTPALTLRLPELLRRVADDIDQKGLTI